MADSTKPRDLPSRDSALLTLRVVDRDGPIVEVLFHRAIATADDVREVLHSARTFMEEHLVPAGAAKAYFVTCYDRFSVSRDVARPLQDAFLEFNREYSKGDARYGGTVVAQTLVISTAIRSEKPSEICATREEALEHLRARIRAET